MKWTCPEIDMRRLLLAIALAAAAVSVRSTHAQSVWSGYDFSFTKADNTDFTLPENQDRITPDVWLSRDVLAGLFNAESETFWDATSPFDTEWATDINNPGDTIAAANWAELTFDPWIDSYGGTHTMQLPTLLIGRNAVVHLISDDIYLDLRFTAWTQGSGGGFAYVRALAPEAPETTGDYNLDGVVDAADYVLWRKTLGESAAPEGSGADGDSDGMIDPDDYDFWLARFGETVPPGSGAGEFAVPEVVGLGHVFVGFVMRALWRRRRVVHIAR
jgi:hypothetical protein